MNLARDGFTILANTVCEDGCRSIAGDVDAAFESASADAIQSGGARVGGRNLMRHWSTWRRITDHPDVKATVTEHVGPRAGLVRILYFDKPPGQGWSLSLHRDKTIAVAEHHEPADPFSKPTKKAGVPHVEADEALLKGMLTLRLHLDAMTEENGALFVVPGSHERLDETQGEATVPIHCNAGDVFLMRPLLLHGSRAASPDTLQHRRVVHLELAPCAELPAPYRWFDFEPVAGNGEATAYEGS